MKRLWNRTVDFNYFGDEFGNYTNSDLYNYIINLESENAELKDKLKTSK